MNRILTLLSLLIFGGSSLRAQLQSGNAYRIIPLAAPSKSLITQNSSLASPADVVIWSETDVASGQWTLAGSSTITLRNVYSNFMLGVPSATSGATARQASSGGVARWRLETVNEDENTYKIKLNGSVLYLTANNTADGSCPVLAEATDDNSQKWQFIKVEPKTTFTPTMREEMIDAYIKKTVERKGTNLKTFIGGSWGESEQLEVVLDAYETTGREDYLQLAKEVFSWFNRNVGSAWDKLVYTDNYHWFGHDFNDDVMWQIIATARLGLLANNNGWVRMAKQNFDKIYERSYIPFTGLMRWAQNTGDPYGTNSCIAGPAEVAACYLGFAGCGEEYFEKARDLYAAQRYTLANQMNTGKVDDSVVWDPATQKVKSRNDWGSTYNQGTMLGAACMLYKYYGDEQYARDARKIMQWTKNNLCNSNGIISACQVQDGDLAGFKGILMRYVRRFIRDLGETDYQQWIEKNALHAYNNRSIEGVTPTAWLQKGTSSNTQDDFALSTAASAAANVPMEGDPALPYEENAKQQEQHESNSLSDLSWSGLYVGGHIRRERPATITKLKESGFTYLLLFNVHVNPDGTLLTDGETICENGKYVFDRTQPHYIDDIRSLKDAASPIQRIEIVIGGWGNDSYNNIRSILNVHQGDLTSTNLYRNFQALKEAIPEIDGVNNDDEQCYDLASALRFHAMMADLGYKTSLAPYMNKTFWQNLAKQLNEQKPGTCDRVLIQCYDGGAANNPADWHFDGIPLLAGRTNYQTDMTTSLNQMKQWRDNCDVVGGFVWVYNDETWNLKEWATGMNQLFATAQEGVATLFTAANYGGYSVSLPEGIYTAGQLTAYGIPVSSTAYNYHSIASIKLNTGYQLTAYRGADLTGDSNTWQESSTQLVGSWRNRIAAIEISAIPTGVETMAASTEAIRQTQVYDLAGRKLSTTDAANPLQGLPRGTYILRRGNCSELVTKH